MNGKQSVKEHIRKSPVYKFIKPVNWYWEVVRWLARGKTPPLPRLLKQRTVRRFAQDCGLRVFVETGTYEGDMVASQLRTFATIHTIELDPILCGQARRRFVQQQHVHVHCGDSGELLPKLVSELGEPALFWLDAHYSGGITTRGELDTPIIKELRALLECPVEHVVLIDDAREFVGRGDYPPFEVVQSLVHELKPDYVCEIKNDIIKIYPEPSRST